MPPYAMGGEALTTKTFHGVRARHLQRRSAPLSGCGRERAHGNFNHTALCWSMEAEERWHHFSITPLGTARTAFPFATSLRDG